eukprot:16435138-Heterocapsa_arctica.AAC.1
MVTRACPKPTPCEPGSGPEGPPALLATQTSRPRGAAASSRTPPPHAANGSDGQDPEAGSRQRGAGREEERERERMYI